MKEPTPAHPGSYPRRALVCVSGLSPQVVTETLFALAVQATEKFIPTEIHVVTTTEGEKRVKEALLSRRGGRFPALLREYLDEHPIEFTDKHVHVILRDKKKLDDIQSPEDSTAAADAILSVVRDLANDRNCAIHASIAGGRKSMSFLLGMCMSLLGRPQDRLSHVLVNEPFENPRLQPPFFYPPRKAVDCVIDGRTVSSADARINLAMINVVWVFDGLGRKLGAEGVTYDELVHLGQVGMDRTLIRVVPAERSVQIADLRCSLPPTEIFLYTLLAIRRMNNACEAGLVLAEKAGAIVVTKRSAHGLAGPLFEQARRRVSTVDLKELTPDRMRELSSRINKALVSAFGRPLAARALIVGPGGSGPRDGHYGLLSAKPEDLYLS